MNPRAPVDERITLHLLRHPPSGGKVAGDVREVAHPSRVLEVAFERADQEHQDVLQEVKAVFYYGNATPSVLQIDRRTAVELRSSLDLRETVFGVWGPETIRHAGALYDLWIQHQLCG